MEANARQDLVRKAARALGRSGLAHAYGHCSARLDGDSFLVCAAMPMGLVSDEPGVVVPISGPLPEGVLGEVRVHQAIYARRADVGGICRTMPPALMALSTQGIVPAARHGIGAYFAPGPALWDDPRLLRDDGAAARVAEALGEGSAIVLRGNGVVVAGETLEQAAVLNWFLEDAARIERDVRMMGFAPESGRLNAEEAAARQVWSGGVVERMWNWLISV
ncbi:class II aldolase/adducin family protein [Novosphingobium resinovorum]|uniref:Aldolase n=1 Tax=Novosphingobium resinovorum TaxID=158500 RepID=A0A031K1L4_9SPHN|nr:MULTISPECIES: class II aldolase/adducin family protein [Novosphingobium]AOR78911.1 aldolase [Novosphingobium resinovorum]EZP82908.1 Class II aldolase/adducin family protein [Novosphingobium resinovorum]MBF7014447.1 class II aldolase/adducin family protein [Novosphingobium sp. HR1a]WJM25070.1 class II aldolase/adducin family protein [Novosphingobium resinovorum]